MLAEPAPALVELSGRSAGGAVGSGGAGGETLGTVTLTATFEPSEACLAALRGAALALPPDAAAHDGASAAALPSPLGESGQVGGGGGGGLGAHRSARLVACADFQLRRAFYGPALAAGAAREVRPRGARAFPPKHPAARSTHEAMASLPLLGASLEALFPSPGPGAAAARSSLVEARCAALVPRLVAALGEAARTEEAAAAKAEATGAAAAAPPRESDVLVSWGVYSEAVAVAVAWAALSPVVAAEEALSRQLAPHRLVRLAAARRAALAPRAAYCCAWEPPPTAPPTAIGPAAGPPDQGGGSAASTKKAAAPWARTATGPAPASHSGRLRKGLVRELRELQASARGTAAAAAR